MTMQDEPMLLTDHSGDSEGDKESAPSFAAHQPQCHRAL